MVLLKRLKVIFLYVSRIINQHLANYLVCRRILCHGNWERLASWLWMESIILKIKNAIDTLYIYGSSHLYPVQY